MMNRRDFLRNGTIVISGLAIPGRMAIFPKSVFSEETASPDLSFEIVTDRPDEAIYYLDKMIKDSKLLAQNFREDRLGLSGIHLGDIAFIENQRLIDFWNSNDSIPRELTRLRKNLSLPRKLENPTLVRMYPEQKGHEVSQVNIVRPDNLPERMTLKDSPEVHHIKGKKGHVDISIQNNAVRVISSSCKHKTCVKMGSIRHPGQRLVCIPNQVMVSIEGNSGLGVDSVTY